MLARHAESMFWAGRYIERAEDTARMLDVTYHGLLEATSVEAERSWRDLLAVLNLTRAFGKAHTGVSAMSVGEFLVLQRANPGSIVSAVAGARENMRSVRELISTELWEALNTLHLSLQSRNLRADLENQPYALYSLVKQRCQWVAGVASETMARDDGWTFLQIGWMLERAEMTCRLLDVRHAHPGAADPEADGGDGPPLDFHRWIATLKSASASEAYRKAYRSSLDPNHVLDFLLLSRSFPRSVLFCLRRAESDLARLRGGDGTGTRPTRPERLVGRLRADLEYRDVHEVVDAGLHRYLEQVQFGVRQAAEAVALQYFRSSEEVALSVLDYHPAG